MAGTYIRALVGPRWRKTPTRLCEECGNFPCNTRNE